MDTPTFILPEHLKLIGEIDEYKGVWQATSNLAPELLDSLKKVARIQSAASSTRIEGARLSDQEVEALFMKETTPARLTGRDEAEVAGYSKALVEVYQNYDAFPVAEKNIQALHRVLLQFSGNDHAHLGTYKEEPNHVEAFDDEGKSLGVVLETATPEETPRLMRDLVKTYQEERDANTLHPLLLTATFIVSLLAIHPFQDGNGRLSRIITTWMLLQHGYGYVPYSSLERIIEERKDAYYLALRKAQGTLEGDNSQMHEWTTFFLRALAQQVRRLKGRLEDDAQGAHLPPLSQEIVRITRERGRSTIREIEGLTRANRNTIKAHVRRLVERNLLEQQGVKKGTWYRLK